MTQNRNILQIFALKNKQYINSFFHSAKLINFDQSFKEIVRNVLKILSPIQDAGICFFFRLFVDYCDVFTSCLDSFWRHPFTAEDLLASKWWNANFSCSHEECYSFTV